VFCYITVNISFEEVAFAVTSSIIDYFSFYSYPYLKIIFHISYQTTISFISVTFSSKVSLKKIKITMESTLKYFIPFFLFFATSLLSQTSFHNQLNDSNDEYLSYSNWSLDIPSSTWGISFGNSTNFNGIRFNYRDCDVETINGFNFTLWEGKSIVDSEVNGISLGIIPNASRLYGINIGIGAIVAEEELAGLNFALLSTVSNGEIYGLNFSGLATVANGNIKGISIGGLAVVANGESTGFNIGGLASVSNGNMTGFNIGGLALVSDGELTGFNFGGLASVANENITGINISTLALVTNGELTGFNFGGLASVANDGITGFNIGGLALVSDESISGINLGGLAIVSGGNSLYGLSLTLGKIETAESINGISISGYKTETIDFTGINVTVAWTEFQNMKGFSFAGYNQINGNQTGLTIGFLNYAENLNGVQIGLINIADNNSGIAKILPFVNAHF
jgi:hypothetical protein